MIPQELKLLVLERKQILVPELENQEISRKGETSDFGGPSELNQGT